MAGHVPLDDRYDVLEQIATFGHAFPDSHGAADPMNQTWTEVLM
jgi:hypothetical protein